MTKAQGGGKQLHEISSDISNSKLGGADMISDDTSQYSSGGSSFNTSQFQYMNRANTIGALSVSSTPRKEKFEDSEGQLTSN